MRLAVVSDIHGNLPALRAVLADIAGLDPAPVCVWCAGDLVGYGPWPDECVQLVAQTCAATVGGNYDEKTLKFARKADKWRRTKHPLKFRAFEHAYSQLSAASRDYLAALPAQVRETVNGHLLLMTHIAPDAEGENNGHGLHPLTPAARFEAIAQAVSADVVITGHTHWPLVKQVGPTLFVNAGSVGRPGDGDVRAAYALLTLAPGGAPAAAQIRRVAYPVDQVIAALGPAGLPREFAALYRTGRAVL